MSPNPIDALKIIIYNTKHTNNTQITFPRIPKNKKSKIHIFKNTNRNDQRFVLIFMTLFIFGTFCIFLDSKNPRRGSLFVGLAGCAVLPKR